MAILPGNPSNLDLTISVPSFSSSSPPSGEERVTGGREYLSLDINQVPMSDEEDEDVSQGNDVVAPPRKKLRLSKEQSRLLEDSFRQNHSLNPKQKDALAKQLMLRPRQVEVWFQNRRARSKLKQTEMECEYLKRWFGSLTEQNRRLQREVEELRAMKVGPPTLVSTHTMCPRCERITAAAIGAPTSAATAAGAVLKAPPVTEESHARRQGPEQ